MKVRTALSEWENGMGFTRIELLSQDEVEGVSLNRIIQNHNDISSSIVLGPSKDYKIETSVFIDGNWKLLYMTWLTGVILQHRVEEIN